MPSRNFVVASALLSTLLFSAQFNFAVASVLTPNTKIKVNLDTNFSLNVRRTPAGEKTGTQQGQATGCVEEISGDWAKINYDQKEDGLPAQAGWVAVSLIAPVVIVQKPDCAQRELPRMTRDDFTGWFGYERVTASDG